MTHLSSPSPEVQAQPLKVAGSSQHEFFDYLRTVVVALLVAVTLQSVVFQPYTISSSSMEPGLVTGDYVVASKFSYGWSRASLPFDPPLFRGRLLGRSPKRGDVVLFRLPRDRQQIWVKRVIGLPGDQVQVTGGTIFVNGRPVSRSAEGLVRDHDDPTRTVLQVRETLADGRSWLTYDGGPGAPGDDTELFTVPADHYLMMGDNRDNSIDGRWPSETGVGLLPAENILGRGELVVAAWKPGAGLFKPWTWFNLQPDRFFKRIR